MRLSKLAILAALISGGSALNALGQSPYMSAPAGVAQVGYHCDNCGTASCGCEPTPACGCENACDVGCGNACAPAQSCHSCGDCGGLLDGDGLCECDLGDPCALLGHCGSLKMGGWAQLGYHDQNLILFNSRKYDLQLHQAWVYAEKEIDMTCGGIGGRIDYIYGTDGPDTQAFGIDNSHWDNPWDHGADYGHAIPQAYLEAGYADTSIKVGHFFTLIGYEVVAAPDNFFYSHAYTMYNSEPFTHTGALITHKLNDHVELYGGWVLGWDSGFEDNGDAFLGGSSVTLTEDITVTSMSVAGRFADNSGGDERGFMHSTVVDVALTECLQYIFQNDWLDTEDVNGITVRDTVGINQYLIYSLSDCWQLGARFEWWQVENDSFGYYGDNAANNFVATDDFDIYQLTLGLNFKPHANVVVRPEIRWDWVDGDVSQLAPGTGADFVILEDNDDDQTTFGIDSIFLF